MNHHAYESPPVEWDEQEAYSLEVERVFAEVLCDIDYYDSLIERLATVPRARKALYMLCHTSASPEEMRAWWNQCRPTLQSELRQAAFVEARAEIRRRADERAAS